MLFPRRCSLCCCYRNMQNTIVLSRLHPRNPYAARRPDFAALGKLYPSFGRLLVGRELDWANPAALVELCTALLHHDFGIRWTMPSESLCPTVPSRLNYLLWVEDLLALRETAAPQQQDTEPAVIGIDIGTGASCIYPLLGHAHFGWRFVATEVDPASVRAAQHNVSLNGWHSAIEVRQVAGPGDCAAAAAAAAAKPAQPTSLAEPAAATMPTAASMAAASEAQHTAQIVGVKICTAKGATEDAAEEAAEAAAEAAEAAAEAAEAAAEAAEARQQAARLGSEEHPPPLPTPILLGVLHPHERFSFCMCNPPWYAPGGPSPKPNRHITPEARCSATRSEIYTSGGEVGFLQRMTADSAVLGERVTWYSSLLGHKSSVAPSLRAVRAAGAVHVRTTEIAQGVTSRWAVAWSFVGDAAPMLVAPERPTHKEFEVEASIGAEEARRRVRECLQANGGVLITHDDALGAMEPAEQQEAEEQQQETEEQEAQQSDNHHHHHHQQQQEQEEEGVLAAPAVDACVTIARGRFELGAEGGDGSGSRASALSSLASSPAGGGGKGGIGEGSSGAGGSAAGGSGAGRKRATRCDADTSAEGDSNAAPRVPNRRPVEFLVDVWWLGPPQAPQPQPQPPQPPPQPPQPPQPAPAPPRQGCCRLRVVLTATTSGEASSAFWRVAEQIRNDVVRDTRKWRRLAARAPSSGSVETRTKS